MGMNNILKVMLFSWFVMRRFSFRDTSLTKFWLLPVLLLVAGLIVWLRSQPSQTVNKLTSLPQHPQIQAFFNQNPTHSYLEPYRGIQRPGDDLESIIIAEIDRAKQSIDIAVQEFKLPRIALALARRQQAGIKVRVILENNYSISWSSLTEENLAKLSERERSRYQEFIKLVDADGDGQLSGGEIDRRDALKILANAQIPVIDDTADGSSGSGLMHHKFMMVDGKQTIVTSANWTLSDVHGDLSRRETRGNPNNLLSIDSVPVAQSFSEEFNLMWGDGPGGLPDSRFKASKPDRSPVNIPVGDSTVTVHFSPSAKSQDWATTTNGLIGQTLSRAKSQIDLALFVFSEPQLGEVLAASSARQVPVRLLIDREFAYRPYSQMLAMLGVAHCQPSKRQIWAKPVTTAGVPELPSGDLLHHKFAVIDQSMMITGSHNWSAAANHKNDETLLVVESPTIATHFQREFDRLYRSASFTLPQKIKSCSGEPNISTQTEKSDEN
jgi:phosphatidylserine/phosphatidylglycerophosphate/cardiolipin synthase-like enzyme